MSAPLADLCRRYDDLEHLAGMFALDATASTLREVPGKFGAVEFYRGLKAASENRRGFVLALLKRRLDQKLKASTWVLIRLWLIRSSWSAPICIYLG